MVSMHGIIPYKREVSLIFLCGKNSTFTGTDTSDKKEFYYGIGKFFDCSENFKHVKYFSPNYCYYIFKQKDATDDDEVIIYKMFHRLHAILE